MSQTQQQMRRDWDERAARDAMHYVLNRKGLGEWTVKEFIASGIPDMVKYLNPFLADHDIDASDLTCLEIGCGAGRHTGHLAARFKRVIALDVSKGMVDAARANTTADNVEYLVGSGIDFTGVRKSGVGFVWSVIVFQHIPDVNIQYAYLRDLARVLKKGGWFLVHLFTDAERATHAAAFWTTMQKIPRRASELVAHELPDDRWKTHTRTPVDPDTVRALLDDVGLELVHDVETEPGQWWVGGYKRA